MAKPKARFKIFIFLALAKSSIVLLSSTFGYYYALVKVLLFLINIFFIKFDKNNVLNVKFFKNNNLINLNKYIKQPLNTSMPNLLRLAAVIETARR